MKRFFLLLFTPQEKNNHRALLLQPGIIAIFISLYLLNQSFIQSLTIMKPGVLGYSSEITAEKILIKTNEQRRLQGLSALHFNSTLAKSAAAKARDMFGNNYWAHNSPSGKTPWDFFRSVGYDYTYAGENLAKDFYDSDSLMSAWMKSPTHKANIVNSKYKEIGIAVVDGTLNGVKTTLVVQHFGTPVNIGEIADKSPEETQMNNLAAVPVENVNVLADTTKTISPLLISKIAGLIIFLLIISVLFIDGFLTMKHQHYRFTGSSAGHIGFLMIIGLLLLFSRQGSIF